MSIIYCLLHMGMRLGQRGILNRCAGCRRPRVLEFGVKIKSSVTELSVNFHPCIVASRPSDAIWWHRSVLTLARIMACQGWGQLRSWSWSWVQFQLQLRSWSWNWSWNLWSWSWSWYSGDWPELELELELKLLELELIFKRLAGDGVGVETPGVGVGIGVEIL